MTKLLLALAFLSTPAFARDSTHLVCTGFMTKTPSPDNYGLAIQFDEHRNATGDGREEDLYAIWAGNLYQGVGVQKNDNGFAGDVTVADKNNGKNVFFQGSYAFSGNLKKLTLKGKLSLDPTDEGAQPEALSTTLDCVNISN
jgi:hypothetical protein